MNGRQAIATFRQEEGLPIDGGQDRWIDWGRMFGMPVPIPNVSVRRPLIPYHDLHHLLSGYGTDEMGESSVSAWTLGASGERRLWGHLYDLGALLPGLVRRPRGCFAAFVHGRRCRRLYERPIEQLLDAPMSDLRHWSGVATVPQPVRWSDRVAFLALFPQILIFWVIPTAALLVAAVGAGDVIRASMGAGPVPSK